MKLYYAPGTCSLSPHIVLRAVEANFELVKVDLKTKITEHGDDYRKINPLGFVPALELSNNEIITEGVAIILYLSELYSEKGLIPKEGSVMRATLYSKLNYLSGELHKSFYSFFHTTDIQEKKQAFARIETNLNFIDMQFSDKMYLLGNTLSIADIYLFVQARWMKAVGLDLSRWGNIFYLYNHIKEQPFTQEALIAEGIEYGKTNLLHPRN